MPQSPPRQPRLLVTTSTLPCDENDGEPRFVLDLSRALQSFFDITILAPAVNGVPLMQELHGVPIVRYRYAPLRRWERLTYPGALGSRLQQNPLFWAAVPSLHAGLRRATAKLLDERQYDCVHCHWALPQGLVQSTFMPGPKWPPYIVTCHGADIHTSRSRLRRWLVGRALARASAITAVSREIADSIDAEPDWQPRNPKIDIIPMGCELDLFGSAQRDSTLAHSLELSGPTVLFVGRLAEKKGLPILIRAMASERLATINLNLIIAGDGSLRQALEQEVSDLGLQGRVKFLGAVSHADLPRLYASADFFCGPFVVTKAGDREGLPTVLSEASAAGLPAIVSDVGGVREIVAHEESGLVVPPGDVAALADAILRMAQDDDFRKRCATNALERAKQYSWEAIGARYANVLGRVIEESQGA